MTNSKRKALINDIIENEKIYTQFELVEALANKGCVVTQATISRDIRELGLIKSALNNEKSYYVKPQSSYSTYNSKFSSLFKEAVVSVKRAHNIVVVKTLSGSANSAAGFIDSLNIDVVLGSVAGDDVIMCVVDNNENAEKVLNIFESYRK